MKAISEERLRTYRFLGLLARSDDYPPKDGPYQDYLFFEPTTLDKVRGMWKKTVRLMRDGRAPDNVILYIHWPFCPSQCRYCFCSMIVPESREHMTLYVESLKREMDAFKDVFKGVELASVYIGGGTPTFIPDQALDELFRYIYANFRVRDGAEVYVEASPATLTAKKLDILKSHGVNRITLGVQSRDDRVLRKANRKGQSRRVVENAWRLLARTPGLIRDVDLMLGIEGQDRLSFMKDLVWSIRKKADVIHINSFDPRMQTLFVRGRAKLPEDYWGQIDTSIRISEKVLEEAGYFITHYDLESEVSDPVEKILSDDPFELSSMFAVGRHGKAHAYGSAWYQHPSVTPLGFDKVSIPRFYRTPGGLGEEVRAYAIRSLCLHERLSLKALKRHYGAELDAVPEVYRKLRDLEDWGAVRIGSQEVELLAKGAAERLVWLKHLYSRRVIERMLHVHRRQYRRFLKEYGRDREACLAGLELKAEARTLHRVYYRRKKAGHAVS